MAKSFNLSGNALTADGHGMLAACMAVALPASKIIRYKCMEGKGVVVRQAAEKVAVRGAGAREVVVRVEASGAMARELEVARAEA